MKKSKHLAEREALDKKGFDSVSSSGSRYKVWPKAAPEAGVYVSAAQLDELSAMKPAEITKALVLVAHAADEHPTNYLTMEISILKELAEMKSSKSANAAAITTDTDAASSKGASKKGAAKAATKQPRERVSKSGLRDEILARINAATLDKNPVIHSEFKNTTEKKIARDLFREGTVQRVERDGKLYYLPKGFKLPKGAVIGEVRQTGGRSQAAPAETVKADAAQAPKKGASKKGASKKAEGGTKALARNAAAAEPNEAAVTQPPAQAEFRRRAKTGAKGKAAKGKGGAKGKATRKSGR